MTIPCYIDIYRSEEGRQQIVRNALRALALQSEFSARAVTVLLESERQNESRFQRLPNGDGLFRGVRPDQGMLISYGYSACDGGPDDSYRRAALDYIFGASALLPVFSKSYVREWGRQKSKRRYFKITRTIQALIDNAGGRPELASARNKWEADLAYFDMRWPYRIWRCQVDGEQRIRSIGILTV